MSKIIVFFLFVFLTQGQDFLPINPETKSPQCFQGINSLKTELQTFLATEPSTLQVIHDEYEGKLKPIISSLKENCWGFRTEWLLCWTDFSTESMLLAYLMSDLLKKDVEACLKDLNKVLDRLDPILKDCF